MDLLVHDGVAGDQAANLALEETLARSGPAAPLLRVWQNESCVVIGRAQRAGREVDLAACAASGVPVLRRASGGAVYQDLGNLNISLAVPGRAPGLAAEAAAQVGAFLTPAPADHHPTDSRRSPVACLRDLGCDIGVAGVRGAALAEAARRYGPLRRRPPDAAENRWQQRLLLAERYRIESWHLTGRTKEAQWTIRPVLTCTG